MWLAIGASGEHLSQLINDILDLSAIEAGKHVIRKERLNFQEIVEDCSSIISESVERKGIAYTNDMPDNLVPINADRRALKQILLNLLSNAVKFTPDGGKLALTAKASGSQLIVSIHDNGQGIPKDQVENITDPFMRGESNVYVSQEGTGLGLAIVKSLVDLHDGKLTIESEVGKGTIVTVILPLGAN